jgi:hypothetical protein
MLVWGSKKIYVCANAVRKLYGGYLTGKMKQGLIRAGLTGRLG